MVVAVFDPFCVVTVMVAFPTATPVTTPLLFTNATDVLSELQLTVLLVAVNGDIVAVSYCVPFTKMFAEVWFTPTLVTSIVELLTVIELVAVLLPSCVVTVIIALPVATPVTSPRLFTVAIDILLDLQFTVLLVAFEGKTVEVSCCVAYILILAEDKFTLTPVT